MGGEGDSQVRAPGFSDTVCCCLGLNFSGSDCMIRLYVKYMDTLVIYTRYNILWATDGSERAGSG